MTCTMITLAMEKINSTSQVFVPNLFIYIFCLRIFVKAFVFKENHIRNGMYLQYNNNVHLIVLTIIKMK
jgi:hypothetical protein